MPADTIKRRCHRLGQLGHEKRRRFYRAFIGEHLEVVVEAHRDPETDLLKGVSSNYLPILFAGPDEMKNSVVEVRVVQEQNGRLIGVKVEK